MDFPWNYYSRHDPERYVFVSPWSNAKVAPLLIRNFQDPIDPYPPAPIHKSMKGQCQIIGSLDRSCRTAFGNTVQSLHDRELLQSHPQFKMPARNVPFKIHGEDVLRIETRLQQFAPAISMAAGFEQKHNPEIFRKMKGVINIKQWQLNEGVNAEAGPFHTDPPCQKTRQKTEHYHAYIISDCAPTTIAGVDTKAYDISAFTAQCYHQQEEISYNVLNDGGRRTMAHIAFYTLNPTLA